MRLTKTLSIVAALSAALLGCAAPTSPSESVAPRASGPWSDEFDGPAGALPSASFWTYDLGNNGGWGNNELQRYTADINNARLDGLGHLVIRVESSQSGYTSARLKTQGLRLAQFGRVEARIKLPSGQGIWPAFWMLGGSFNGSNWPDSGEIDIMESMGSRPGTVYAAVHGPKYSGGGGISGTYSLPSNGSFADDFHTFAVEWAPASLRFMVDGAVYHSVTPQRLPPGALWVFDQSFFVLLNVAVGGNFVGPPDTTTRFPQEMLVDYVRYIR